MQKNINNRKHKKNNKALIISLYDNFDYLSNKYRQLENNYNNLFYEFIKLKENNCNTSEVNISIPISFGAFPYSQTYLVGI